MKIPTRIIGFIEYDGKNFPFEFDKDKYMLKFYFPTENDAWEHLFDGINAFSSDLKRHEWVQKIQFTGKTAEGYLAVFGTSANPGDYHGYRTYEVDWFYIANYDSDTIDEIRVSGNEVDYFFPPSKTFTQNIVFKDGDYNSIEKMSIDAVRVVDFDCGEYMIEELKTSIKMSAYPTMHTNSDSPFDAKSYMYIKFSKGLRLNDVIDKALTSIKFLKYICYRNNNNISEIQTFIKDEDGAYKNSGCICIHIRHDGEVHPKAKDRIITAEMLGPHTSEIMKAIDEGSIPFGHLCRSIEDMRHYPVSRMIMILSSFEREFRNIYGQNVRRSEEYAETKQWVVSQLKEYANSFSGRKKKYVNGFARTIENIDSSYGDNLKYALEDCKNIMRSFVVRRYNGEYEEIIEDVSRNINALRNGIAHSRLDLELEARHLTDIKFVEELLYVIRLKSLGIEDIIIQKAINSIFNENLAI